MWIPSTEDVYFGIAIAAGLLLKFLEEDETRSRKKLLFAILSGIIVAVYATDAVVNWANLTPFQSYGVAGLFAITGEQVIKALIAKTPATITVMIDRALGRSTKDRDDDN
jgi:hypothetical protein